MLRPCERYQYKTSCFSEPLEIRYSPTWIGGSPGASISVTPDDSKTHPAPGRQCCGEWIDCPVRWVGKYPINRPIGAASTAEPLANIGVYSRFRKNPLPNTARVSVSSGISVAVQ